MCLEHVEHWERIASRWRPAFSSHLITNYHLLDPKRYGGLSLDANARDIVLRFACFSATKGDEAMGQAFKLDTSRPILKASPTDELDYVLLRVEDRILGASGIEPAPYESRQRL